MNSCGDEEEISSGPQPQEQSGCPAGGFEPSPPEYPPDLQPQAGRQPESADSVPALTLAHGQNESGSDSLSALDQDQPPQSSHLPSQEEPEEFPPTASGLQLEQKSKGKQI